MINLFGSRVVLGGAILACTSFGTPVLENWAAEKPWSRQDTANVVKLLATIAGAAYGRYSSDGEGETFTPQWLPGRNRSDWGK